MGGACGGSPGAAARLDTAAPGLRLASIGSGPRSCGLVFDPFHRTLQPMRALLV